MDLLMFVMLVVGDLDSTVTVINTNTDAVETTLTSW